MDDNEILIDEAAALLSSSLTGEERDALMGIKHDLNASIRWGKVVDESFGPIVEGVENLLFHGGEGLVKTADDPSRITPVDSLFSSERARLVEGDKAQIARHFVTLLLTKKLLGALKTRVNQALNSIRILTEDEELEALIALDGEQNEAIEAEFVGETGQVHEETTEELVARIGFRDNWNCKHVITKVRHIKADGTVYKNDRLETFCKDCRNVVNIRTLPPSQKAGRKKKKPKGCQHRYAEWVLGAEGQTARCVDDKACAHLITAEVDLRRIKWVAAGLEPYGDDPAQDEVTVL